MHSKIYRIAICDDEADVCLEVNEIITEYGKAADRDFKINTYDSSELLYDYLSSGYKFDFLFLDIIFENTKLDGIELGMLIREQMQDSLMDIVYISNCQNRVEEISYVEPKRFLNKPITKDKVIMVLETLIQAYEGNQKNFFEYHVGKYIYRIEIRNIVYLKINNREIYIKMIDGEDYFIGRIGESFEKLRYYDFIMANKSCIVNYYYITLFSKGSIVLSTGEVIELNQRCYKVLDQLHRKRGNRYKVVKFDNVNARKEREWNSEL